MRDDRHRILELAEEKSLVADEGAVRDARAALTNPRKRLAAEVGWLPGVAPAHVSRALSILAENPAELRSWNTMPALARTNLLGEALEPFARSAHEKDIAAWIVDLAQAHESIDPDDVAAQLNEARADAQLPSVANLESLREELRARRRYFTATIKRCLDQLPSTALVDVVTRAVDVSTRGGTVHAPILIDDMVDTYEVEVQGFFDKETTNLRSIVQELRDAAARKADENAMNALVNELERVVKNWDYVAQPIQVSFGARGLNHELSHEVASEIRELSIELFNEHRLLDVSRRLTAIQQDVFAEVGKITEQLDDDADALDEIAEQRAETLRQMEEQTESWAREITYEATLGIVLKKKLRISPEGIQWKTQRLPLEAIVGVRWGGAPTGKTYDIVLHTQQSETRIALKRREVFQEFVQRLWKAVGVRLLTEMLEGLREGKRYQFATAVVSDDGVTLRRRRLLRSNQHVLCAWRELTIGNGAGTFSIAKKGEKKVSVKLPYLELDNVHILEVAMRMFSKNPGRKLSDLLQG